ncbi:MAG: sulfatase-like hydrolase/transferase [Rhizobiales bacterium]|nr:sulfatase-like hydrolase/transferase [Hyphomicrobiales bacterium]
MNDVDKPWFALRRRNLAREKRARVLHRIGVAAKVVALAAFILVTNFGFLDRVSLLAQNGRWATLVPFLAVWGVCVAALYVAAFQPRFSVRALWAIPIALSTACAWSYFEASKSDLNVFDVVSLWSARHEASRAAEFYSSQIVTSLIVFALGFLVIVSPPAPAKRLSRLWLSRLSWVPIVPIVMIAAIIVMKQGGGSQALPKQFAPIAVTAVAAERLATQGSTDRRAVEWTPQANARMPHIVMLVDESIRADFLELTPGSLHTPELAKLRANFVDFGPAASAGNCSHYSNALLRFAASRRDTIKTVRTNPTIWEFAKKAGYRTVYIDGQAGVNKNPGLLQNFMSVREKQSIDGFYTIQNVSSDQADFELLKIIDRELKSSQPVFIYANKNGAHFPYDKAYPAAESLYGPTMSEAGEDTPSTRIASYRNAVRWSVDHFFDEFFKATDLANTAVIYTSDHGQALLAGQLTHCVVEDPDPVQGLVPLMAITGDKELRQRFEAGARLNQGRASHFEIAPTLLELMGYRDRDVQAFYGESLFTVPIAPPAFTSGDVFGLFSDQVNSTPVDLNKSYLDSVARTVLPRNPAARASASAGENQTVQ